MKRFTKLLVICLLVPLGTAAQIAVKAGSQITSESSLVSGKPYLVYYVGNGNSGYMKDTGGAYTGISDETATTAAVYFFTTGSTKGTWKVQNAYTGKYWGTPTANANTYIGASDGGDWALNFQTGGNVAPSCNEHSWNRSGSNIHPWNSGTVNVNQFKIFEVALSTTALSEFGNFDINVSSSEASTLATGVWYVMKNRGRKGYAYEVSGSLRNAAQEPYGAAANAAQYLVRLCDAGDGKYYLQNGWGNYFGIVSHNVAVPTTPFGYERYTIGTINSSAGHFYLSSETDGYVLDCQENGNPVVGWYKTIPTTTGGNNDWAFYPVTLTPSFSPAITEVYTINNTNPSRGAMMYYPAGSTRYVWSSGKNNVGFDASSANCMWVIIPTDTEKQYYLYNVGAGKFAIPSGTASTNSWIFSDDAVAVSFILQSDNTYKIKTVTTNTYAAISNNYIGPIINYNDIGGNFTITKVSGNQSAAALAAKNRLVESQTALTQSPSSDTSQWYVIRIKQHATYSDCFIYSAENEINYNGTNYPLTFDHGANIRPAISNANYFTRITPEQYWQMPNGRYLHNAVNKYPVATTIPEAVNFNYETNGFVLYHKSTGESQYTRYAVPYYLGSNFFIGETANKGNAYYDIYPINLESTGLTPWKVSILNGGDNMQLSCNRSDVSGLTKVYDGGWFFLPDNVTPTSSDFSMAQMESCIIDASNKTITVTMPAGLAITENDVTVEQGFQTAGRDAEVMLLRITASPFNNAANAEIGITFKDGAEKLVSGLTLYEASSNSPEILGTGSGAPTRTAVTTTTVDGTSADVTLNIGSFTAGTHYYWLAATIKSDATLGAIVDAAVKNIVCTNGSNEITTDLTSIGDPADRGAMVFNAHSYPFLPWDEGSKIYRIPAMVVANDGSIVVAADKRYDSYSDIGGGHVIDIVVRRSTDGGKTWGTPVVVAKGDNSNDATCGYGDPTLVKTQSGKLICTSCAGNLGFNYGLKRFMVSTSSDNGITWTSPVDVTEVEGMLTNKPGLTDFFITSGKGILTSEGILMYLVIAKDGLKNYVIYSVDEGEHWVIDDQVVYTGGNEAKLELANDGSLIASVRQGGDRGFNFGTYEYSNGAVSFNWGTQYQNSQLNAGGAANNQDVIYYQRSPKTGKPDYVFHSMTTGNHANLKLYYSTDGAKNWTEFLNVQTKGTRYVTMAKAGTEENSGSLYLFFEDQSLNTSGGNTNYNHYPLNFIEITRDQLLQYIPNLDDVSSITDGKYYRIRSKLYDKHMVEKISTHQVGTEDVTNDDYTALWKVSLSGTSLKLQNAITDRYIQLQGYTGSVPYTTGTSEATFTLAAVEGQDNTYTINDYVNPSNANSNTGLHSAASQNYLVVGWYSNADASRWVFEEVTPDDLILTVSRDSYQKMQDMVNNTDAYTTTLQKYFTDGTCTTLKSTYAAMSDNDLKNEMLADGLVTDVQNMAVKVKNNAWKTYDSWNKTERTFRVADYNVYSDYNQWTSILKYTYKLGRLTNPTGISGTRNEIVSLYVGTIPNGQTVALEAVPLSSATGTQYVLHEGYNAVILDDNCTLFICNSVDNTTDGKAPFTPLSNYFPVTVHIEGGFVNGYFDLTRGDTDTDWAQLKANMMEGSITDLKTAQLTFHLPTDDLKSAAGDELVGLLNIWDGIMTMERSLQGLEEYDGYWNNPLSVTSPTTDYMHASDFGTFYADYTLASIMNYANMSQNAGNIWGPAHEMGHIHQRPINMIGCTEISNNVYSNIAVYQQGHATSRTKNIQDTFTDFANGKSWLDRVYDGSGNPDLWQCTHLYWQLYQYFHLAGYNTSFYPELYKALRQSPMTHTGGVFVPATEDYLKFYKTCCEVSGYDLTEFFQVYGFFTLPTEAEYTLGSTTRTAHLVSDYGNFYVYTTQEMIDAVRAEVKAMKLKPCNIIFIEDRIKAPDATYEGAAAGEKKINYSNNDASVGRIGECGETGQYTDFRTPVSGEYAADVDASGNVSVSGGTGAVGFKVYDTDGDLVLVSNTHEFQLPADLIASGYVLKVAQGDGNSAPIAPLYKNVTVNYAAGGFYTTLYAPVPLTIPSGARAFGATLEGDVLTLHEYKGIIPALQGALIEFDSHPEGKAENFLQDFSVSEEAGTPIEGNRLTGSLVDADPRTLAGTVFTFAVKSGQVGFYKYTGNTLKAGKAFLLLTDGEAQSVRGFTLEIPTGISSSLVTRHSRATYDLQGRRVNGQLPKGMYIVNGKKVFIK